MDDEVELTNGKHALLVVGSMNALDRFRYIYISYLQLWLHLEKLVLLIEGCTCISETCLLWIKQFQKRTALIEPLETFNLFRV